jgi:hypothetical protein
MSLDISASHVWPWTSARLLSATPEGRGEREADAGVVTIIGLVPPEGASNVPHQAMLEPLGRNGPVALLSGRCRGHSPPQRRPPSADYR